MPPATGRNRPQLASLLRVVYKCLKSCGQLLSLLCPYMGRDPLVETRKDGFFLLLCPGSLQFSVSASAALRWESPGLPACSVLISATPN